MQVRYYRDSYSLPRADVGPPHEVVGWFLEQDLQGDVAACRRLLNLLNEVESGIMTSFESTGNAHTVTLGRNGARIENEYAEPPVAGDSSLDDLKQAISGWLRLLTSVEG